MISASPVLSILSPSEAPKTGCKCRSCVLESTTISSHGPFVPLVVRILYLVSSPYWIWHGLAQYGQRFHAVMELRVTSSSHVLSILPQSEALKWECVHRMWYDGIRNHHSPDLMVLPDRLDLLYRESHCLLDTPNPRTLDQPTSSTNLTFLIGFVWFQLLPHALCES